MLVQQVVERQVLADALGPARTAEILARHERVTRDLISYFGGREVEANGGFVVLFERPLDAVAHALECQDAIGEVASHEDVPLAIRVGIHLGEVGGRLVFALLGLGEHFVNAVINKDQFLILGIVLTYATMLVLFNLLVDVAYAWVDPRIELG